MAETKKEAGNTCFKNNDFNGAVSWYSQAIGNYSLLSVNDSHRSLTHKMHTCNFRIIAHYAYVIDSVWKIVEEGDRDESNIKKWVFRFSVWDSNIRPFFIPCFAHLPI